MISEQAPVKENNSQDLRERMWNKSPSFLVVLPFTSDRPEELDSNPATRNFKSSLGENSSIFTDDTWAEIYQALSSGAEQLEFQRFYITTGNSRIVNWLVSRDDSEVFATGTDISKNNIDSVTTIRNHVFLESVIPVLEHSRSATGIAFVDVDNLKRTNDDYGHSTGNLLLKTTAIVLQSMVRESDFVGRWGGDEFLIFLNGCDAPRTARVDERFVCMMKVIQSNSYEGFTPEMEAYLRPFVEHVYSELAKANIDIDMSIDSIKNGVPSSTIRQLLGFSTGVEHYDAYDHDNPPCSTIAQLIDKADKKMLAQKFAKKEEARKQKELEEKRKRQPAVDADYSI